MADAYFCWLVGLIGDEYIAHNYQKLLWKLYSTEYLWQLDYDGNRAEDGLMLRTEFIEDGGVSTSVSTWNKGCTVLEMLLALSHNAEDRIMHDPEQGDRSGKWFWEMIQNLHLDIYDDWHWFEPEVTRILDAFNHYRYGQPGPGCALPIHHVTRDPRNTDLWWQMNAYLEEHYPI